MKRTGSPAAVPRLVRRGVTAAALTAIIAVVMAAAGEPVFVRWLDPANPGDATIRVYWERVKSGEASPDEIVDLGTMLFHRGFATDAARMYKRALDRDPSLAEAWLRLGLVEHDQHHLRAAERAYRRCLKRTARHPWCQFYLGRLLEQTGRSGEALEHYRVAFTVAPQLADPEVNPEVLQSQLALGAQLQAQGPHSFTDLAPLDFQQPRAVGKTFSSFLPPTPTPAPTPEPSTSGTGGSPAESGTGRPSRPGRTGQPEAARPAPSGSASGQRPPSSHAGGPQPVPPAIGTASGTAVFQPR